MFKKSGYSIKCNIRWFINSTYPNFQALGISNVWFQSEFLRAMTAKVGIVQDSYFSCQQQVSSILKKEATAINHKNYDALFVYREVQLSQISKVCFAIS
jgi:hypothetical protein